MLLFINYNVGFLFRSSPKTGNNGTLLLLGLRCRDNNTQHIRTTSLPFFFMIHLILILIFFISHLKAVDSTHIVLYPIEINHNRYIVYT